MKVIQMAKHPVVAARDPYAAALRRFPRDGHLSPPQLRETYPHVARLLHALATPRKRRSVQPRGARPPRCTPLELGSPRLDGGDFPPGSPLSRLPPLRFHPVITPWAWPDPPIVGAPYISSDWRQPDLAARRYTVVRAFSLACRRYLWQDLD